jgi:ribosomal protein S18 acetylase RimI-like enzyme
MHKPDVYRCIELSKEVMMDFTEDVRTRITDKDIEMTWARYSEESSACFVYEFDGFVVGMIAIHPLDGLNRNLCELLNFYVMKEARGNGYGGILFGAAEDFAKEEGYDGIYLETRSDMAEALAIYHLNGYQELKEPLVERQNSCHKYMIKYFD